MLTKWMISCSAVAILAAAFASPSSANAGQIWIDEYLFEGEGSIDPSIFSSSMEMSLVGDVLTILLQNTTQYAIEEASWNLLASMGFQLPDGVSLLVSDPGGVQLGPDSDLKLSDPYAKKPGSLNLDSHWGWFHGDPETAPYKPQEYLQGGTVNTIVGAHVSHIGAGAGDGETFDGGKPQKLKGPDFGLLSSAVDASVGGGLSFIQDTIQISLNLTGLKGMSENELLAFINAGHVAVAFGSPDGSYLVRFDEDDSNDPGTHTPVPEPGTMLLFSVGAVALAGSRRRAIKKHLA